MRRYVTIKSIEYAVIEKARQNGWVQPAWPAHHTGKKVAVIGSGPAGLACADQLNRVGHEVTVVERRIVAEAPALFGDDPRTYAIMTKRFLGDEQGHLCDVVTADVQWIGQNGHSDLREIPGPERTWPAHAQMVLLAMGFLGAENPVWAQLGVAQDAWRNIQADEQSYQTNVPGVFAAGGARRDPSLVIWTIREGRGATRAVDRYLMGETDLV